jgi:hypothetical protein
MPTTVTDYIVAERSREAFLPEVRQLRTFAIRGDQILTGLEKPLRDAILVQITEGVDPTEDKQAAATATAGLAELIGQWEAIRDRIDNAIAFANTIVPTILEDLPPPPEPTEEDAE